MATNIATKYGIILTAISKPSLAPDINSSYTFNFLTKPAIIKIVIIAKRIKLPPADEALNLSSGERDRKYHASPPMKAKNPPKYAKTTFDKFSEEYIVSFQNR